MKILLTILSLAVACSSGSRPPIGQQKPLRIPLRDLPQITNMEGRIVNGNAVRQGQIPYIVGLIFNYNELESGWCGGSIIGNTWILTAAHCIKDAQTVTIYYGSTKREKGLLTHNVGSVDLIPHPKYDNVSKTNDLALIRTPKVDFSNLINKVDLPARDSSYDGQLSIACGWGDTFEGGPQPDDLLCADLKILSHDECSWKIGYVGNSKICTSSSEGRSICDGDSGGPLVTHDGSQLIGVSSYGINGCESGFPAVFSRVSANLDWIRDITGIE